MAATPDTPDQIQRRSDYRLIAPLGALIYFTAGDQRKRVKMMDVSLSGASGILINIKEDTRTPAPVEAGQTILNLKLAFTVEDRELIIPVRECQVIRYVDLPTKGRYLFAVAFTRMDQEHKARLRELLYNEQRQMLRIRNQRQKR